MTSETVFLRAWQGGNAISGDVLLRRHLPTIFRFLVSRVGYYAEELTQRVMLAALERRDVVDPERGIRPFLFGLARIELLRHLEGRSRKSLFHDADPEIPIRALDPSPSQVEARCEDHGLLMRAMGQIPLEHQMVIELFYWEEFDLQQIAVALDVPVDTVKSRLHRARAGLRNALAALAPDREFAL